MSTLNDKDVLINIMYTGDYTNKNIGHEIINLYKTDKGENYIYISPWGKVAEDNRDKIKEVVFARGAGKGKLEIIGKASELEYWERSEIVEIFAQKVKDKIVQLLKIKKKIQDDIKQEAEKQGINLNLRKNPEKLDKNTKEYEFLIDYRARIKKDYSSLQYGYLHDLQIKYIEEKGINFGGVPINKIFDENYHSEPPIYLTYKAKNVKKLSTPIIIDYMGEHKNIFGGNRLRNNSCLFYVHREQLQKIPEYQNAKWEDTKILSESEYKDYKETFLDIIGKSNDELAFSNMIAYFFEKDKELFRKFCEYCNLDQVIIDKTYEISREVKVNKGRIDILIKTDNSLFVIENKVKSGINGEEHDPYTETYSNQLINYYKYFQDDDIKEKELKGITFQHYFMFTPNYNKIEKEEIKKKCTPKDENIIDSYNIVKYGELKEFFSKYEPRNLTKEQKIYFNEFINSLEKHLEENDNKIEQEMEYKFREAIKNTK